MNLLRQAGALRQLWRDARRGAGELEPIIAQRVKDVLVAAMEVPHYGEFMARAHYDPRRDYRGPQDLALFPVLRKADIKAAPEAFLREGAVARLDQYFSDKTSGSTGIPLTVYRDDFDRAMQVAKWLRVLLQNGYRPTDKVLSYTAPGRLSEGRTALQRFGVLRRKAVDFTLSPEACTDALLEYRPRVVYGVLAILLLVAEELQRRSISPAPIKLLVAGGEVIDKAAREHCRQAFGIEITETYGSVEMGVMACQRSDQAGLDLIEDCTFFEFLDEQGEPAGPGQLARLVVTNLFGRLMPLIRYDHGDLAHYNFRTNARGETVRVIERIVGRQDDVFRLPDGRTLTLLDFYGVRFDFKNLRHLRITQRTPVSFRVEVVADPEYFLAIRDDFLRRLRRLSELALDFEIRLVERIAPDPGGKLRMLVSEVRSPGRTA